MGRRRSPPPALLSALMIRLMALLALAAVTTGSPVVLAAEQPPVETTEVEPEQFSKLHLRLEVQPEGQLHIRETIEFSFGGKARPPLTRQLWLRQIVGMFPLRQRVSNLRVTDGARASVAHRVRRYMDWYNIDLDRSPLPAVGTILLDYTVSHGVFVDGQTAHLVWNPIALFWNLPVAELEVEILLPTDTDSSRVALTAEYAYEPYSGVGPRVSGNAIHWSASGLLAANEDLVLRVAFPADGLRIQRDYLSEVYRQARLPLLFAVLLLLLALPLRTLSPRAVVAFTRGWNALCAAVVVYSMLPSVVYWIAEDHYRGGDASNTIVSLVGDAGVLGFVLLYVWRQDKALARGERAAYFTQFALPVFLAFPAPLYDIQPAYLLFWLMGLPLPLYWLRRRIAFHFGADTGVIVEHVNGRGQLSVVELANAVGVPRAQLTRILRRSPELPVVTDFEHDTVYSAEIAALRAQFSVCPNCGGGTETKGMSVLRCGYCKRELASGQQATIARPVPVIVDALARLIESVGYGVIAFAGVLAVAFALSAALDRDAEALIVLVIPLVLALGGWWIATNGKRLRDGQRYWLVVLGLTLSSPLVVPLLALGRLRRPLVKLHFGRYPLERLASELQQRGELDFGRVAEVLGCGQGEGIALARYLCAHDLLAGVYDRVGFRVVARDRYRDLASASSCLACGGLVGIVDGAARCHHCGTAVADAA